MKIALALLAALALAACMGPSGNPNGQPYADSGMIAVKPMPAATVQYDPKAEAPDFGAMQIGQPGLTTPPPAPMPAYRPPPR
jgi:hypothetical protein